MKTGIVTKWKDTYGFIKDDDDGNEYFCHFSSIIDEGFKKLEINDVVTFELGPGATGRTQAIRVTMIGECYE